jgi:hypothetical protein
MALKAATQEGICLLKILQYLKDINLVKLTKEFSSILVDNLGTVSLSSNPTHHNKTKHIDISYHFRRETIESGNINVLYIPDKLQVANPLTKGLPEPKLAWFKSEIDLENLSKVLSL